MTARLEHKLDLNAIKAIYASPQGAAVKDLFKRGLRVESAAKKNLQEFPQRVDTGRLRSDIHTELIAVQGKYTVRVGTNVYYALFVHDGTGIYAPRHQLIRPKSKKVMRWKGNDGFVYAKYTRGMIPNPFLKNALPAAKL